MQYRHFFTGLAAAGLLAGLGFGAPARAADFYAGKQVSLYIGYPAGTGYDQYARLMADNIGRFLPGHPHIIPRNMPGAGSMRVMNFIYRVAPKDGTVWGAVSNGAAAEPLLYGKASKADFDTPFTFNWIGSLNTETGVAAVWHTTGITTWEQARTRPIIVSISSSHGGIGSRAVNSLLHTHFEQVCCYGGGGNQNLAMERGEVQGRIGWSWSSLKISSMDWLKSGKIHLLMQIGLKKNPDIPGDLPLVIDLAKSKKDKQALKIIFSRESMGRPFLMPPGVPADRVALVRTAFMKMVKDPALLAQAKRHNLLVQDPISGEEIETLLKDVYASPPEAIAAAREAIKGGEIKMVRKAPKRKKRKKK